MKPTGHRKQFNIDANVWMYKYRPQSAFYRPYGQRLTAQDIHRYVDILADSGVDTLTVNGHCTQFAYYPSRTVPTVLDLYKRGDRSFFYGHVLGCEMTPEQIENFLAENTHLLDGYLDLMEAGVDWLAETAKACRRRKISPWVSIRMNDVHGATKCPDASYMNCDLYKDPAMRLQRTKYNIPGFNYEKRKVRNYVMAAIRDMVDNYDFEGLQLEWNRQPLCCEPDASQAMTDVITKWHAEIRRLTEKQAGKIGKPYPLGIKYVGSLDQLRSIGLDLREMAKRGILDFVSPTNDWQSSWDIPCDELRREFGPDVAIYGAIEFAPNYLHGYLPHQKKGNPGLGAALPINYRLTPYCPPMLRGNAAAKLVLGVDGIEVYNFPCADQVGHWPWEDEDGCAQYPALQHLDDIEFLRGKPKCYTLSSQNGYYTFPPYETVGAFPTTLGPGDRRACRLPMCSEPVGRHLEFIIQVVVEKKENLPPIGVYLNGSWPRFDGKPDDLLLFPVATMTRHTPDHVGLDFTFPLASIREGWNEIVVMNGTPKNWWADQKQDVAMIVSLELAVRGKQQEHHEQNFC
ncbi:MAG: hypothetical protein HY360_16130 [Verrucomicrobia bacterium]|nr:hypothetical protein [Verrucomicrobiota bacterium]